MQVLGQIAHNRHIVRHIVVGDPLAFFDSERCADRLAVLANKLARRVYRCVANRCPGGTACL